jgi:hypothetical protein
VEVSPVFFHTVGLRPNHRVTVRNAVDGWDRDVYTHLPRRCVDVRVRTRPVSGAARDEVFLDGALWMSGANPQLPATGRPPTSTARQTKINNPTPEVLVLRGNLTIVSARHR